MRYFASIWLKRLQNYQRSKLEVRKKSKFRTRAARIWYRSGRAAEFSPDLQLLPLVVLLPFKDDKYFIWNLQYLSICIELYKECSSSFKVRNVGSKYSHLCSAYSMTVLFSGFSCRYLCEFECITDPIVYNRYSMKVESEIPIWYRIHFTWQWSHKKLYKGF